jgi:hypothetical protein
MPHTLAQSQAVQFRLLERKLIVKSLGTPVPMIGRLTHPHPRPQSRLRPHIPVGPLHRSLRAFFVLARELRFCRRSRPAHNRYLTMETLPQRGFTLAATLSIVLIIAIGILVLRVTP